MDDSSSTRAGRGPQHARPAPRRLLARTVASALLVAVGFSTGLASALLKEGTASANGIDIGDISGGTTYISAPVDSTSTGDPDDESAGKPLNILLIGTDVRTGEDAEIGGYVDGARSDTTIIMHISADRTRVEMVSIPRDTRVQLSVCESRDGRTKGGYTKKFNAAFSVGYSFNEDLGEAVACTMRTVTDLTGIQFDGQFIAADFSGFQDMIDALDGVPMCIPFDVDDKDAKLTLSAGAQTLNGKEALGWARARKTLGDGSDIQRLDRQQDLMMAILEKFLSVGALTDVTTLTRFVKAATSSFSMSEELASPTYDLGLAFSLRNIDLDNVTMMTAPWGSPGDGSGDVVFSAKAPAVWQALIDDEPLADVVDGTADTGSDSADPDASATPESDLLEYLPIPPDGGYTVERPTEQEILDACDVG